MNDLICKISILLPDGRTGDFTINASNVYSQIAPGHTSPAKLVAKMAASLKLPVKITSAAPKRTYKEPEPPKRRGRPPKEKKEEPAMATMSNMG